VRVKVGCARQGSTRLAMSWATASRRHASRASGDTVTNVASPLLLAGCGPGVCALGVRLEKWWGMPSHREKNAQFQDSPKEWGTRSVP